MKPKQPHEVARYFFQSLMMNQCSICWGLFSDKTQKTFIEWTLKDIYQLHSQAAETAKLGPGEIKLMFENNQLDLIIRFWRRFVQQSRAGEFHRYGYFNTVSREGSQATVEVNMIYPNGQEVKVSLIMILEKGSWRFGYLESGLRF